MLLIAGNMRLTGFYDLMEFYGDFTEIYGNFMESCGDLMGFYGIYCLVNCPILVGG